MSGFSFRELTRADAEEIAGWRYEEPYSLYDGGDPEFLLEYTYFAGLDEDGALGGLRPLRRGRTRPRAGRERPGSSTWAPACGRN